MGSPESLSFQPVFDEIALTDNSMEIIETQGRKIVLAKRGGKIHAFENNCPHLGGPLGRGTLQGNTVVCPLHHWTFDLASGKCVSGLPDEKIAVYETQVENGKILLKMA
jgi:nitrite reductase (NADH) small subunit